MSSESSSPSKTPEDEGSKSWEEWQVSLGGWPLVTYFIIMALTINTPMLSCFDFLFLFCTFDFWILTSSVELLHGRMYLSRECPFFFIWSLWLYSQFPLCYGKTVSCFGHHDHKYFVCVQCIVVYTCRSIQSTEKFWIVSSFKISGVHLTPWYTCTFVISTDS